MARERTACIGSLILAHLREMAQAGELIPGGILE
jgi:hypothetical protein